MTNTPPVFDGHNDFLLRLLRDPEGRARTWLEGDGTGHIDLPRVLEGGFAGGLFAIYIPSADMPHDIDDLMDAPPYAVPLPRAIDAVEAQPVALAMAGHLLWMERASEGRFKLCRSVAEIRDCMACGVVAGVMHLEGAEPIAADLDALHAFHAMGLRSLGPVWSRPTVFGHGVPFAHPSGPDTGPGLTPAGRDLVRLCDELRIAIDLSHLNAAGFDDVAALSEAPLIATHSNVHALSASSRNLTDDQLDRIRESRGMVGVNFAVGFLAEDGRKRDDIGLDPILRHLDRLMERLGEDHVGFGSDFDGATVPAALGDVAGLVPLRAAMRAHGYDDALMVKLCHENWLQALSRVWER